MFITWPSLYTQPPSSDPPPGGGMGTSMMTTSTPSLAPIVPRGSV